MIGAVRLIFDFSPEKRRYGSDEILIGIAPAAQRKRCIAGAHSKVKSQYCIWCYFSLIHTARSAVSTVFTMHYAERREQICVFFYRTDGDHSSTRFCSTVSCFTFIHPSAVACSVPVFAHPGQHHFERVLAIWRRKVYLWSEHS